MEKKPFWRRVNRGLVVSVALLAIVAVYVLVTQAMLLPEKKAVEELAQSVCTLMLDNSMLSEEEISSLQSDGAREKKQQEIQEQLKPLFAADSSYAADFPDGMEEILKLQELEMQAIYNRGQLQKSQVNCQIEQDTAIVSIYRKYTGSQGKFWDYSLEKAKEGTADEVLNLSIVCKKTDGVWKIYRISGMSMNAYY
ncbi:MAG TPA: hypothetical protein H9694_08700 [Firmicutes bacterium]|nr:hypothetical protein [Bacillota bacterium]